MPYLALNQAQLSQFSHHWLFGLRRSQSGSPTLYDMALHLQSNPKELESIASQLEDLSQRPWIIQVLYWMFNINESRNKYYSLQSYVALQLYQQGISMLSPEEKITAENVGAFVVFSTTGFLAFRFFHTLYNVERPGIMQRWRSGLISYLPNNLPRLSWGEGPAPQSSGEIVPLLPTVARSAPQTSPLTARYFTVKADMLDALITLGLHKNPGEKVLFEKLKLAYRDSLILTHPDKTRTNSNAPFIAVREAFKFILNRISQHETQDDVFIELRTHMDRVFNERVAVFRALQAPIKEYIERADQHIKKQGEGIKELREGVAQYNEKADAYIEKADAYIVQADEFIADSRETRRRVFEFAAEVNALVADEEAQYAAIEAIIEMANMYDAFETAPMDVSREKNRHRFIGQDAPVHNNASNEDLQPTARF